MPLVFFLCLKNMEEKIIKKLVRNRKRKLLNFFFPTYCLNCGAIGSWLCPQCHNIEIKQGHCFLCNRLNKSSEICAWCKYQSGEKGQIFSIDAIYRYGDYRNPKLKNLIWAFKYSHLTDASFLLAELLSKSLESLEKTWKIKNCLITCIPMNLKHKNTRGYNQAKLLALLVANNLKLKYIDSLVMSRKREFRVISQLVKGQDIVLIDDVITTGETVNQASLSLKKSGAKKVMALSLA